MSFEIYLTSTSRHTHTQRIDRVIRTTKVSVKKQLTRAHAEFQ